MPKHHPISHELRLALGRFSSFSHDLSLISSYLSLRNPLDYPSPFSSKPLPRKRPTARSTAWREASAAAATGNAAVASPPSAIVAPPGRREVLRVLLQQTGGACRYESSDQMTDKLATSEDSTDYASDDASVASYDWDAHHARIGEHVRRLEAQGLPISDEYFCNCNFCLSTDCEGSGHHSGCDSYECTERDTDSGADESANHISNHGISDLASDFSDEDCANGHASAHQSENHESHDCDSESDDCANSDSPEPFREIFVETDGNEISEEEERSESSEMDDDRRVSPHSDYDLPPHVHLYQTRQAEDEFYHQPVQSNRSDSPSAQPEISLTRFASDHLHHDQPSDNVFVDSDGNEIEFEDDDKDLSEEEDDHVGEYE